MAADTQTRFHEEWLGLAQPYEGLVFSVPVLADAQITPEVGADLTARFRRALVQTGEDESGHIGDLATFFEDFLGYTQAGSLLLRDSLPEELHFYAQEGGQDIRPSFAIARSLPEDADDVFGGFGDVSPQGASAAAEASSNASPYIALVWDVRDDAGGAGLGLSLDAAEELTGAWRYSPTAKFERLLRATGVAVGFLCNGRDVRLVYAPGSESTSHLTFRGEFMQRPDGRPILAAFELLLGASRTYEAGAEFTFEGLLKESRSRQADVTKELALQVFEAVELLLSGFEAASNRDSSSGKFDYLRAALEEPNDHAYQGVLSVVLRLVFLLYAEDQSLLPVKHKTYAQHLSVKGLYDELVNDAGQHPESMSHRFGAYGRLLSLFRSVFFGVDHGELHLPPRRGRLFDPNSYPFLEGGLPGTTAAVLVPEERAATRPPSLDDGTVYEVLHRLVFFQGQRLSYASLDVEQLGSVYESLMGFHVLRTTDTAVRLGKNRLWIELAELRKSKPTDRKKLLKEGAALSTAQIAKVDALLKEHKEDAPLAEALNEMSPGGKKARHRHRAVSGQLLLQPGEERRRSGSHYTPRSLTEGIVRRTLEPLLKCLGEAPTEEQLLSLKICDPAMGSGAFLVEVVRQLGQAVVQAWTRAGQLQRIAEVHANPDLHAMRLVAQRCVYGVDKNPAAVELAKLSLWLVTLSAELPFTFVDHSLRHGDSLVGLSLDQVGSFNWKPEKQLPMFQQVLKDSLDEALEHRAALLELAKDDSPRSQQDRRRLLDHADQATNRIRMVADICVGAFFAEAKDKQRNAERVRRLDLVVSWLKGESSLDSQVQSMADEAREQLSPFHWMLEFPEVFYMERPDPLDGGKVNGAAFMDAFVGNPPFLSLSQISRANSPEYVPWLRSLYPEVKDKSDLVAHFFRRAGAFLGQHGTIGLIATKSIAEGDTRDGSLRFLVEHGFGIYAATRSFEWPGEADVSAAIVHLAVGSPAKNNQTSLDGQVVERISSSLRAGPERKPPVRLSANRELLFSGVRTYSDGFLLSPDQQGVLLANEPRAKQILRPYVGGSDINSRFQPEPITYAIWFRGMSLGQAQAWPRALDVVERHVRPGREQLGNSPDDLKLKREWWRFHRDREELYAILDRLPRCIVMSRDPKHICFTFGPASELYNDKVFVFAGDSASALAILQSRIHVIWAIHEGRTTGGVGTPSYASKRCFDPFPFPQPDPRTVIAELEAIGKHLYEARAKYMVETAQGLTKTYNALKDPACDDPRILELRALHEEMDRAVLRAYPKLPGVGSPDPNVVGWSDIEVPPFCIATDEDRAKLQAFEDEVIDRLFVLNEIRAKEEKLALPKAGAKKAPKKKAAKEKAAKDGGGQGSLF